MSPRLGYTCYECGAGGQLLRCTRCRVALYCSKEHQKKHWKRHKKVCKKPDSGGPSSAAARSSQVEYSLPNECTGRRKSYVKMFPSFCFECGVGGQLLRCIRCRVALYCSKDHQRKDWHRHKKVCRKPDNSGPWSAAAKSSQEVDSLPNECTGLSKSYVKMFPSFCFECGVGGQLLRCIRCRVALYCSKDHQRKDWHRHKKVCREPDNSGPSSAAAAAKKRALQAERDEALASITDSFAHHLDLDPDKRESSSEKKAMRSARHHAQPVSSENIVLPRKSSAADFPEFSLLSLSHTLCEHEFQDDMLIDS